MAEIDPSKYYQPDKPCRNGHLGLRRIVDGVCVICEHARLLRWKKANRPYVMERDRNQRARDPQRRRDQERARYASDPAKFTATQRRHYLKNSEVIRERRRSYHHANYPTSEDMRASAQARTRQWSIDNPERAKANRRNGKAKRQHISGTHTADDIADIFKMQNGKCAYCREPLGAYEVDHIRPVAKGGTNDRRNIQLTCAKCNRTKSARDPETHARLIGLLI